MGITSWCVQETMKTEKCQFSGQLIYPGHGKRFVRGDCRSFLFSSGKTEKTFLNKTNPRKVKWTQVYRKVNKKGAKDQTKKRRRRKVIKVERGVVGASVDQIREKRARKPEIRAAGREAALREVKARTSRAKKGRKGRKKREIGQKKAAKTHAGKGR